jgi:hypothetical protein
MKLRIDPAYLAGLMGVSDRRRDVEHCVFREVGNHTPCLKATKFGKAFCLDHIEHMPYAGMISKLAEGGQEDAA